MILATTAQSKTVMEIENARQALEKFQRIEIKTKIIKEVWKTSSDDNWYYLEFAEVKVCKTPLCMAVPLVRQLPRLDVVLWVVRHVTQVTP